MENENGIGLISWINVKSALVYGLLSALLAIGIYTMGVGDVFKIDWQVLLNAGIYGFLTVIVSLLKNLLSDSSGKFLGLIQVIPKIEE